MASGGCWKVKPNVTVKIVKDAGWSKPIGIGLEGERFWMMHHVIRFSYLSPAVLGWDEARGSVLTAGRVK